MLRQSICRFLSAVPHLYCGVDAGGTTTKFASVLDATSAGDISQLGSRAQRAHPAVERAVLSTLLSQSSAKQQQHQHKQLREDQQQLYFMKTSTQKNFFPLLHSMRRRSPSTADAGAATMTVPSTGGGSVRFAARAASELNLNLKHVDEMAALVRGVQAMAAHSADHHESTAAAQETTTAFFAVDANKTRHETPRYLAASGPLLLVQIGSGVSFIAIDDIRTAEHRRLTGSALGGAAFFGLAHAIMPQIESFEQVEDLLEAGADSRRCDLTVGDIYGQDVEYPAPLTADVLAASFGKIGSAAGARLQRSLSHSIIDDDDDENAARPADIVSSLVKLIAFNITQIAMLAIQADERLRSAPTPTTVLYSGGFTSSSISRREISYAHDFWAFSSVKRQCAHFLRDGDFSGAVGAMLSN